MLPDITSISLFLKAVNLRNLTKAAESCHMSLSAASRRLASLEHHFRTPLLERHHTGVVPTAAGEALARHAQLLMRDIEAMQTDLSDYAKGAVGRIRLLANTSAMSQVLPEQLDAWSRLHPDIKLDVQEMRSQAIVEAVLKNAAEIGIVTTVPIQELRFEPYCLDRLCIIVPQHHPLRVRSTGFADLLDFDFVGLEDSAALTQAQKAAAAELGRSLRLRVQVQSFEGACRLVAAGLGISILPKGAVEAFKQPMKLRFIGLNDAWANRQMYVCVKKGSLPATTTRLLEHLTGKSASPP